MCVKCFCKGAAAGMVLAAGTLLFLPEKRTRCMKKQARHTVRSMEKALDDAMDCIGKHID